MHNHLRWKDIYPFLGPVISNWWSGYSYHHALATSQKTYIIFSNKIASFYDLGILTDMFSSLLKFECVFWSSLYYDLTFLIWLSFYFSTLWIIRCNILTWMYLMVFVGFLLIWPYLSFLMKFVGLVSFILMSLGVLRHDVSIFFRIEIFNY